MYLLLKNTVGQYDSNRNNIPTHIILSALQSEEYRKSVVQKIITEKEFREFF